MRQGIQLTAADDVYSTKRIFDEASQIVRLTSCRSA
uniref:Uncharacterized protein n=1 Tax=Arundo donax TaxID=35708 RepID=A0A0A8YQM6_ARUDO